MAVNDVFNDKLETKKWFKSSDKVIVESILGLPKEYDGFKRILTGFEGDNTFGELLNISDFRVIESLVWVKLRLRSKVNNQEVFSEFVCWKDGNNPLARGIVLVEKDGKVVSMLLEKKYSLVSFSNQLKTFSVAYPDFEDSRLVKLPEKLAKSIGEYTIKQYYDLGVVEPEDSIIGGKTSIFAIKVSGENMVNVDKLKVELVTVDDLTKLIGMTKDAYLLAIIAKLKIMEII